MAKDGRSQKFHGCLRLLFSAAAAALAVAGCGPGTPPLMPDWAPREQTYVPEEGSSNAYDSYALIARNVEETVPQSLLNRVFFDPDHENAVLAKIDKPLSLLVSATKKRCEFRFTAPKMFEPAPYQRGWRLLGRALQWKIEQACITGSFDQAIDLEIAATKFGFDLTGGSATDASLGFEIADEARRAIAPFIAKFGAAQLGVLADGLSNALDGKPPLKVTIEHEHTRMLQGIQYVQDAYAAGRFDDLMSKMGEDVRDGVAYLRDLKSQDAKKRPAYFEGFAQEAEAETNWLTSVADLPATQRKTEATPDLEKQRPWKSFAKQFFTAAVPLLKIQDSSIARTRLAILTSLILRQVKTAHAAPKDLSGFSKDLTLDPYTGRAFAYRASGPIFAVYSLGSDGIDDAGDTDESFTTPDLTLEDK
ncbi:MAG TPA: hypothetical protein VHE55_06770 [Fimbriimonadaceae bacterium]|nr:hypothetical protein [Fimbriimonadaceae bacterium]